jgi:hypothetical protein
MRSLGIAKVAELTRRAQGRVYEKVKAGTKLKATRKEKADALETVAQLEQQIAAEQESIAFLVHYRKNIARTKDNIFDIADKIDVIGNIWNFVSPLMVESRRRCTH